MTACWFGSYDRGHSANRLLRAALLDAGFAIEELHAPLWETTRDKDGGYFGPRSLGALGARWTAAMATLARRWRARTGPPPVVIAGFGGHLDVLAARRLCHPRIALVFAPLVSLTETLVDDRRVFPPQGLRARAVAALDRATLRAPDLVLADTGAHATWLAELGAPADRVAVWHFGIEPAFRAPVLASPEPGRVLFYGRGLPLHGLDTIVAAAARLGSRATVTCIGSGPERSRAEAAARALGAAVTWRDEVPLETLPGELARAAVVLGVFGTSRKAAVVVPNKVYQAAAAGRPLVTRDGPGLREVLTPDIHCLAVPPGDAEALAGAIVRLLDDRALAERLGAAARAHVLAQFGPAETAARLRTLLVDRLRLAPDGTRVVSA